MQGHCRLPLWHQKSLSRLTIGSWCPDWLSKYKIRPPSSSGLKIFWELSSLANLILWFRPTQKACYPDKIEAMAIFFSGYPLTNPEKKWSWKFCQQIKQIALQSSDPNREPGRIESIKIIRISDTNYQGRWNLNFLVFWLKIAENSNYPSLSNHNSRKFFFKKKSRVFHVLTVEFSLSKTCWDIWYMLIRWTYLKRGKFVYCQDMLIHNHDHEWSYSIKECSANTEKKIFSCFGWTFCPYHSHIIWGWNQFFGILWWRHHRVLFIVHLGKSMILLNWHLCR